MYGGQVTEGTWRGGCREGRKEREGCRMEGYGTREREGRGQARLERIRSEVEVVVVAVGVAAERPGQKKIPVQICVH